MSRQKKHDRRPMRVTKMAPCMRGFTLAELAIVLVIVALLIGGMLMPLSAQQDQRNYSDTQKNMGDIVEALIGYAASHPATDGKPYLPCPDTNNDGRENRISNSTCTSLEGRVPWNDLGVGREDSWGNRFRYRVTQAYADKDTGFTLASTGGLKVCESAACTAVVSSSLPVVIVSHGKNGAGAYNTTGTTNTAPLGDDEKSNQDLNNNFVLHTQSTASGSEFDDIVTWLSPNILYNRMIAAGKLP